jgi:predicted aldo/keto reductase-like oxidoreductase
MIHGAQEVETLRTPGFHAAMDELKKEGRVRFLGVSNHGSSWRSSTAESMETTLLGAAEDGRFDVMLFAYNYLAREIGEKILTACAEKKIGATLMKTDPVGRYYEMKREMEEVKRQGGQTPAYIQREMPKHEKMFAQAQSFLKENNLNSFEDVRPAAIRFVLSNQNVSTVCLTFRNFDYVKLALELSGSRFTDTDEKTLSAFAKDCGALYCRHACGQCESQCPHGVPVNTVMRYNHYFEAQGCEKFAMTQYRDLPTSKADRCAGCDGYCAEACPHGVPIPALLTLAHRRLSFA